MTLERFEILIHKHYHVSLDLLEQVKRGIELAATEEGSREAEERYRQMLRLHQHMEKQYLKYWRIPSSEMGRKSGDP